MSKQLKWFSNKKYRRTQQERPIEIEDLEKAVARLNLSYNFGCVKFILDTEKISFGMLRCAQFFNGTDYYYDYNLAAYHLVRAGLIGSEQESIKDLDALEAHTYKILDYWLANYGDLAGLYLQLIKQLEERHFFMTSATSEMIQKLSLRSSYKSYAELMNSLVVQGINEQMQLNHMQNTLMQHMTDIIAG